jgi:hypothetical protein
MPPPVRVRWALVARISLPILLLLMAGQSNPDGTDTTVSAVGGILFFVWIAVEIALFVRRDRRRTAARLRRLQADEAKRRQQEAAKQAAYQQEIASYRARRLNVYEAYQVYDIVRNPTPVRCEGGPPLTVADLYPEFAAFFPGLIRTSKQPGTGPICDIVPRNLLGRTLQARRAQGWTLHTSNYQGPLLADSSTQGYFSASGMSYRRGAQSGWSCGSRHTGWRW